MDVLPQEASLEKALIRKAAARRSPISATLELLPLCNLNCGMCYVRLNAAEQQAQGRLRSGEEWLSLGRELQDAGVVFLLLTGGEPLLHPDFREIYTGLQSLGMILTLNTNGTLLDAAWADFFAAHKPRRINITLYGASPERYAELCGNAAGYDKALAAVRLLQERGVAVKLNGSAVKANANDLETLYRTARELQLPLHVDSYMLPGLKDRFLPFSSQARLLPEAAAEAQLLSLKRELSPEGFAAYVTEALAQTAVPPQKPLDGIVCQAGYSSFAISWKGELRPCVSLRAPAIPVFEKGFPAAWAEMTQKQDALRVHPKCASCRLRPICQVCVASAEWETGHSDAVPEYCCRQAEALAALLAAEQAALSRSPQAPSGR